MIISTVNILSSVPIRWSQWSKARGGKNEEDPKDEIWNDSFKSEPLFKNIATQKKKITSTMANFIKISISKFLSEPPGQSYPEKTFKELIEHMACRKHDGVKNLYGPVYSFHFCFITG